MKTAFRLSGLATFFSLLIAPMCAEGGPPDKLIDALDLTRPDLAEVKTAADRGDWPAARKAFADHLRRRTSVTWHFDPANPPKKIDDDQLTLARNAREHQFTIMDVPWKFEGPIDWRFNPTTRPDSKVAVTHEWTWGLNRHHFWPALAQAYRVTGDAGFAEEASRQIADWCAHNPAPARVPPRLLSPWRQIEAGIRMGYAWPETFFLLVKSPEVFPDDTMLAMVDAMRGHAGFLMKFPTHGNWKTMESNGLFHVGALFPEFKEAETWRAEALARQRQELDDQVYPDGVQMELAPGYHNLALRMFVNTFQLAELNKIPVPAGYREALERMFDMNLWSLLPDRTLPDFNDSGREGAHDMLEEGLTLFPKRSDWKWVVTDGKEGAPPTATSHLFPYAGWAVMRSDWSRDARCLIMEGGPFGLGHQHEDKLSFILYAYGSRLIAEAGIYPYFVSKSRDYSIAAEGHNVLSVDGLQQSRRGGPRSAFVTKSPLDLNWQSNADFDYVQASFGQGEDEAWGDKRLRGFVHARRVLFAKPDYWMIIDSVVPRDDVEHTYETAFHLDAAEARIDTASRSVGTVNDGRTNLTILPAAADDLQVHIVKGQKEPELLGWIANDTLELQPVPAAYYVRRAKGPVHTLYVLAPTPPGRELPIASVRVDSQGGTVLSASIIFKDHAVYGQGIDRLSLANDGTVTLKRGNGSEFSSRK